MKSAPAPGSRSARARVPARAPAYVSALVVGALFTIPVAFSVQAETVSRPVGDTAVPVPATLDLDTVLRLAMVHNAGYRAELARRDEVLGGVREVGADARPQVELVGNWVRTQNPTLLNSRDFEDLIDVFPGFEPQPSELWTLAVQVDQPLYTGGKVRAAIDLAELVVEITDAQIAIARLDLALDAAETLFEWQRARGALDTLEVQRRARTEALRVVRDRYDLGLVTELDRLRARSALAEVEPGVARVEGNLRSLESRLRGLLGFEPSTPIRPALERAYAPRDRVSAEPVGSAADPDAVPIPAPAPDSTLAPIPDSLFPPPALDALLELAERRRPELRDLRLQTEALGRQRITTAAERRPQVDLSGAYGRQVRLLDDLGDDRFDDWRVGVGMTWKLFDGGRIDGQLAQIDSQREQLRWRIEEQRRGVAFEIERSLGNLDAAVRRWQAAHASAEASAEALRVARESYDLGLVLQSELLETQDEAVSEELLANEAFYDCLLERARLSRAVGLLPTESLQPEPFQPETPGPEVPTDPDSPPRPDSSTSPESPARSDATGLRTGPPS